MTKLRALDLFSGIGGLSLALSEYAETVAYCEQDRHAQAVLFSRMETNDLDTAPIWDDIKTLTREELDSAGITDISLIMGGFPCQDTSVAGLGKGLAGERSGLFYEIVRLAREIVPEYLFIENVAGLRKRGLDSVLTELAALGYDCRYTFLSAAAIGAPHKRERFFLLARKRNADRTENGGPSSEWSSSAEVGQGFASGNCGTPDLQLADSSDSRLEKRITRKAKKLKTTLRSGGHGGTRGRPENWSSEPGIRRVAYGVSLRVDRIMRIGNAVVPQCARIAFEELLGLSEEKSA